MHSKFESKSNRVKGLCFHPNRPWILSSLHNGAIQLWDYRNKCLLHTFEEHDGPVRGVDFHESQPLFASGGDDYKIKVWNYKLKRCLFTLLGHLDYVRTVKFHHEHPWILSASDDQTIRLWNWQSRSPITTLTGHNHYVMSAFFHPSDPLVVSASLDNTVRVWDIGPLVKNSTNKSNAGFPAFSGEKDIDLKAINNGLSKMNAELFGGTEVSVKFILEGHEKGVNWATFHPNLPLIVSGADDRQIKLWRMNETKAWEVDTLRGHTNNVSSVIFHPTKDLIVSNAEDRSIKVWDVSRRVCIQTFKREHDRFWVLCGHPTKGLVAAGHDSGMMVFNLERERSAYDMSNSGENELVYVKDERFVRRFKYGNKSDDILATLPKVSEKLLLKSPKQIVRNEFTQSQSDMSLLVLYDKAENGMFQLVNISSGRSSEDESLQGLAIAACFVARNRFVVLEQNHRLSIRNLKNETTKRINPSMQNLDFIFPTGTSGRILAKAEDKLYLYEVQSRKILAEMTCPNVKYVVWDKSFSNCALITKSGIVICDKNLNQKSSAIEVLKVKGAVWNQKGNVLIYSTLNHVKYLLTNGDMGVLATLDDPIYITKFEETSEKFKKSLASTSKSGHIHTIFGLSREGKIVETRVNMAECDFKVALMCRQFGQVMRIIKNNKLDGQAIIGYLQEKGFPEVALHFVEDPKVRFRLALSCGNLDVAMQSCLHLDENKFWDKLATEALNQGNYDIVEMCYQKTRNFDKLSFLYLIGSDQEKLTKMVKIAENRNDSMARFQTSIFIGKVEERIKVLEASHQLVLAFVTARTHGLAQDAERLEKKLVENGIPVPDVSQLEANSTFLPVPKSVRDPTSAKNWPLLEIKKGVVHEALQKGIDLMQDDELVDAPGTKNDAGDEGDGNDEEGDLFEDDDDFLGTDAAQSKQPDLNNVQGEADDLDMFDKNEAEAGWDAMQSDDDLDFGVETPTLATKQTEMFDSFTNEDAGSFKPPRPGVSVPDFWPQNSSLAVDHAAAGKFESAKNLLNRQIGVVEFSPLLPHMKEIYLGSNIMMPTFSNIASLETKAFRNDQENNNLDDDDAKSKIFSLSCFTLENTQLKVNEALSLFQSGRFPEALSAFRDVLYCIPFIVTKPATQFEVKELVSICKEYILGLLLELERKQTTDKVRALELACYFASCKLKPRHMVLVLNIAMKNAYKVGNFITAAYLAKRLLGLSEINAESNLEKKKVAQKVLKKSEMSGRNEHQIDFKADEEFDICCVSLAPIYAGEKKIKCPFSQAVAKPDFKGEISPVTQITRLGDETLGLLSS